MYSKIVDTEGQLPNKKGTKLLGLLKNNLKKKNFVIPLAFIILLLLLSQRVALVQVNGGNKLIISVWPISEYNRTVLKVDPLGGIYHSRDLNISFRMDSNISGEENAGKIWLRKKGKNGSIKIGKYKVDYLSLDDAHERTINQDLKNGTRSNFTTKYGKNGIVYKIMDSDRRLAYLYSAGYIYFIETSSPELYDLQNSIAKSIFFGNFYTEVFKLTSTPVREKEKFLTIQRKIHNKTEDVYRFERNSEIIRWGKYILYNYIYGEDGVLSVFLHDINTGMTDVIFRKETDDLSLYHMEIINDDLYVTLGEYLKTGETYWIDLNDYKKVNKLANTSGNIVEINGMNYFLKGEGDACWSTLSISSIDLGKKLIRHIADAVTGCISGDEYLGVNRGHQIVLASHEGAGEGYHFPVFPPSLYTKIFIVDSLNPSQKRDMISSLIMPPNILVVKYSQKDDKLLLVGDSVYIYSFASSKLEKMIDLPKEWTERKQYLSFNVWKDGIVCVSKVGWESDGELDMYVDLNTKLLKSNHNGCPEPDKEWDKSFEMSNRENSEKIFKNLNLPKNYILVEK